MLFHAWTKREIKLLAAVAVCAVLLVSMIMYFLFMDKSNEVEDDIPLSPVLDGEGLPETGEGLVGEQNGQQDEPGDIVVDVKGAVKQPGIYHLPPDARVYEAIAAAGGTTDEADETQLNLADFLTDGMAVIVPAKGDDPNERLSMTGGAAGGSGGGTSGKVNVNRATEEELQTLTGIGPAKAAAIIRDREENGPFKSVDDLTRVSGIGEKTLDKLRDDVTVR